MLYLLKNHNNINVIELFAPTHLNYKVLRLLPLYSNQSDKFSVWLVLLCFLLRLNGNQDDVLGLKVLKFKQVWGTQHSLK